MDVSPDRFPAYSWHQSHDQATVLLLVPYGTTEEDVLVAIEQNSLVARVRGQPPIVKGRLYAAVDATNSMWQLERAGPRPARARTISTASSRSSYALVSDPGQSQTDLPSSCAVSIERDADSEPDSELSTSSPAFSSPSHGSGSGSGGSGGKHGHGHISLPQIESLSSSFSSVESLNSRASGRLLTLHLEKTEPAIWPALIAGPAPVQLTAPAAPPPGADPAGESAYNADPTSLGLLGVDCLDVRKDRDLAFEFFLRAWHQARTPLATLKLVTHFLPVNTAIPPLNTPANPGTPAYYIQALGGQQALARLYLEAGLILHLEGAGAMHHGAGALSSIRTSGPITVNTDAWRRDRDIAKRYFDRARALDPQIEVPALATDTDDEDTVLGLRMPELPIGSAAGSTASSAPRPRPRRRREKERESEREKERVRTRREKDETGSLCSQKGVPGDVDGTWYLYLPGLLGAGTALLAVAVIGAVSVSSWRKSQS